jgi:hypothetical protein
MRIMLVNPILGNICPSFITQTGRAKAIITQVSDPRPPADLGNKKSISPHSFVRKGLRPVKRRTEVPLVEALSEILPNPEVYAE